MKRKNARNDFLIASVAITVCILLLATAFSSASASFSPSDDDSQYFSVPHKNRYPDMIGDSADEDIINIIQQVNESMIRGYIENITAFGPRLTGTPACENASAYIYHEFEQMGYEVRYHYWPPRITSWKGSNIEATLPGVNESNDGIYIICGHYDSVQGSPGADDDGSGIATVLSAAKILRSYAFNNTIRFVTFSGEEQGLFGSKYYVQEAQQNGDNIIAALNVDMIGYAATEQGGTQVIIRENEASSWLTDTIITVSQHYSEYIHLTIQPKEDTSGTSDHYSFWRFGYDAVQYRESQTNPKYHSPDDTIENMNITYAIKVVRLALATLVTLSGLRQLTAEAQGPYTGVIEDPVHFFGFAVGGTKPYTWCWDFGNGDTSTEQNPIYAYDEEGVYTVTLTVTDSDTTTATDTAIVTILCPIEITAVKGGLGLTVSVKNNGSGNITDLPWIVTCDDGFVFPKEKTGTIPVINAGAEKSIKIFLIGFGKPTVTVQVGCAEETITPIVFLIFVKI